MRSFLQGIKNELLIGLSNSSGISQEMYKVNKGRLWLCLFACASTGFGGFGKRTQGVG